jgi:hypothetical protein
MAHHLPLSLGERVVEIKVTHSIICYSGIEKKRKEKKKGTA